MVHIDLRLACLSIAAIFYQVQAAPLPYNPGDVVYMPPVHTRSGYVSMCSSFLDFLLILIPLQVGGQGEHPHVVMSANGHNLVVAPVTHANIAQLGHNIPVPANQQGTPDHRLTGNVLQMQNVHAANVHYGGRLANSHVDASARHIIASSQHQQAANAHTDAAAAHTHAANMHTAIGNTAQAMHHTTQAAHHTAMATTHQTESHNHALAAAGQAHTLTMGLEHVTPSKHGAHASAQAAHQSAHVAHHVLASMPTLVLPTPTPTLLLLTSPPQDTGLLLVMVAWSRITTSRPLRTSQRSNTTTTWLQPT
ncbi:hypothetical protein D9619_004157 [Psilocybe cf. subviscida]|uniref:Uncharacterized protein n=1 Tax=Psilocybe cf. subviscida TaxID=2480587 RepID=A0A8H5BS05_9AGAR|nr:hypothetical protein D9619_004157 [Psilocybe cf. subviscida]